MSTQQDIYVAGSETRPPMLNKENYVPWSSRLLRYAKSRPNGKLIYNSIMNGPYTDEELAENELKQVEADDQAIQGPLASRIVNEYEYGSRSDNAVGQRYMVGISLDIYAWAECWNQEWYNASIMSESVLSESRLEYWGVQNVEIRMGLIVCSGCLLSESEWEWAIEVEKSQHGQSQVVEKTNDDLTIELNDREDIGKLGAKGDIGFFIGYSLLLLSLAFQQRSIKTPGLQSMTLDKSVQA
ncbi:hypothetical protein Tco_0088631 [Tanacetum coccineum]